MRSANFTRVCLLLILVLLLVLAFRPYSAGYAAQGKAPVQYKVIYVHDRADTEAQLNALAEDGWTYVGVGRPAELVLKK